MVLMALTLSACFEQSDCLITNTNILKITPKGRTLGKDTTVTFLSVRLLNGESDLYTDKALSSLEIPVDIADSTITVIFQYNRKSKLVSDTLRVGYRNELRVIAPDCGAYLYQHDVHVSKTNFEKTRVTTSVLLTTIKKNLEIFL